VTDPNSAARAEGQLPEKKPRARRTHPNRRPQQSERSRQDILDAASRIISEYGFREATIDLIAEAAGISPTSIYWHFGNREGMLAALATRITDRYQEAAARELGRTSLGGRQRGLLSAQEAEIYVRTYARAISQFALDHPQVIRSQTALSSEGVILPTMREGVRDYTRTMRRPTIGAVDRGVELGIFCKIGGTTWIDFVIGSLMGASIQIRMHRPDFDPVPPVRAVHDAALRLLGLMPRGDEIQPPSNGLEGKEG
jgi:AcrR family transcriptional regulator